MVDQLVIDRQFLQHQVLRVQDIVDAWDPAALNQDEIEQQLEVTIGYQSDLKHTSLKTYRVVKDKKKFVDDGYAADLQTAANAVDVLLVKLKGYKRIVTNTNTPGTSQSFKLERIKLPKFSGQFSEWQSFHDLFLKSVNDNTSLSGAEKMIHLKTCLTGEAASIVSAFEATDANYIEAWKLVKQRFSNKREIIFSHIKKFDDVKPLQTESASGLRAICDSINECSRSLLVLGVQVQHWDLVFIYFALKKVDKESKREWLLDQGDAIATLKDFLDFMEKRARALSETPSKQLPSSSKSSSWKEGRKETEGKKSSSSHASASSPSCTKCHEAHHLFKCNAFGNLPVKERVDLVKKNNLCFNCLFRGHSSSKCKMNFSCKKCGKKHHTLIHSENPEKKHPSIPSTSTAIEMEGNSDVTTPAVSSSHSIPKVLSSHVVLLGTVLVTANDSCGEKQNCRVFMDPGSESHFVSERCVDMLGLPRRKTCVDISGIGGSPAGSAKGIVNLHLFSRVRDFSMEIHALILPKVSCDLPRAYCNSQWPHLKGLELGDPKFFQPGPVDILLGASATALIMLPEIVHGAVGSPTAQNTKFGWMLSGDVNIRPSKSFQVSSHHASCTVDNECLQQTLEKFWELEEPELEGMTLSQEEELCEEHFVSTHVRNLDGSYTVELPFKPHGPKLGHSREAAVKRFLKVENRLNKDPKVREDYIKCMNESISNNYMELAPAHEDGKDISEYYYMPHREVIRESSSSTKVRIVFDASASSSNGLSLNDILMTGPKLQIDLVPLLLRFRGYPVAMSADIVKFFHQFHVNENHLDFQRLVWRESTSLPIRNFRMKRVTFGLTCAPYLAIRCLNQLAEDEMEGFPLASCAIKEEFLVDNLLSGAQDVQSALHLQSQILEVMGRGKLNLTKWSSNCQEIVESVPEGNREYLLPRQIKEDKSVKTIGLLWNPGPDTFGVSIVIPDSSIGSKRKVLSSIAKIFDPLGWLSPVTIRPKILMQELWKMKLDWDATLPEHHLVEWQLYCRELEILKSFHIDRCIVGPSFEGMEGNLYELHGFCDASESAYAACVFLRTRSRDGQTFVRLVIAKTKVAPVKSETIPRLELCGALLLCKLLKTVQASLKIKFQTLRGWTDSTIVLDWIGSEKKLPVFVANRVRKINQILPRKDWNHVSGDENPADPASRGISALSLINHPLWFQGPAWLLDFDEKGKVQAAVSTQEGENECILKLVKSCSSFLKMRRIVAYCIRFGTNSKLKKEERIYGPVTAGESRNALMKIVVAVQKVSFQEEIGRIGRNEDVKSKLKFLCPFLDEEGILRVGGRLHHSNLTSDQKHPILLPRKHNLTNVIFQHFHQVNLHAAPQLLLACVRDQFWILRGLDVAKQIVRECVICHRQNPRLGTQLMGQLPHPRVTPSRPFSKCGVDYAGPFKLCARSGRNPTMMKSYVALFICFATRAIHLEWVSDLSTNAFIAALTRFVSRRGLPSDIYCDGGTNFVGAKNEIEEFVRLVSSASHKEGLVNFSTAKGISFHFNPPRAPHHGGLWEAGVKSMKFHLARVMEERNLTVEEFITLLSQVEGSLNSRPIAPMSNDPNDFGFLTPGHFLIGDSLSALPRPDLTHLNPHRIDRWQAVQQMFQHFWRRWHSDYLSNLQNRPKWYVPQPNLSIGDLVIIRDDEVEWGKKKWKLGRIAATYPGKDGCIRVCDVRIANGHLYKRPVVKLSALPINSTTST